MKRLFCLSAVILCLALCGCSMLGGSYVSVEPHQEHIRSDDDESISAANFSQLRSALEELIRNGAEQAVITVPDYNQARVESDIAAAIQNIQIQDPIAAYAVDTITYEVGSGGGKPAIAVTISYLRSFTEIRNIREVDNMTAVWQVITETLESCDSGIVLLVDDYSSMDITQMVEDYAQEHPETVMEIPQVVSALYPDSGSTRVLELQFTYQNSRDTLRQMQTQVQRVFSSASLYINSDDSDAQKFAQLYTFLMERFDYQLETSITPAYSLLRHGVGDSRAFAMVYAAMCRQAGLECHIVVGTHSGEPRYWNIVLNGDNYYHVDLLRSSEMGRFRKYTDNEMNGYVWDYSAYPECPAAPVIVTDPTETDSSTGETAEATQSPEVTVPSETGTDPQEENENS